MNELNQNDDKKMNVDIDEKINRLQKQNKAETKALKKLLDGLDKIGKTKVNGTDSL